MPQHAPAREGRLAVDLVHLLQGAVGPVDDEGQVDLAGGFGDAAGDDGDVALVHLPLRERVAQAPLRLLAAAEHEQPGRAHVEPVHHEGVGQHGLHARGEAVLLVLAPAGHGQQAGGLEGDDQVVVDVDQFGRHRRHFRRLWGLSDGRTARGPMAEPGRRAYGRGRRMPDRRRPP